MQFEKKLGILSIFSKTLPNVQVKTLTARGIASPLFFVLQWSWLLSAALYGAPGESLSLTSRVEEVPRKIKEAARQGPAICLNMIVKNEAAVIERCLASVKDIIDYWVIVDTGSTDGTQEAIKKYMKDIPGALYERKWVDFEHNRNEALALAKDKGDYILLIDADQKWIISDKFNKNELNQDAYYILCQQPGGQCHMTQLVSSRLDWKWKGVLHEVITCPDVKKASILQGVLNQVSFDGARNKNPNKYLDDALVLESALKKEPRNSRYRFYLGRSYRDAGDLANALKNYEKRVKMGGDQEEIFWSLFEIARIQDELGAPADTYVAAYQKAFGFRPSRVEPLYYLVRHYLICRDYSSAYKISKKALLIPPHQDISIVEQWIYDYGLLFQFSDCAYHLGKYEEAIEACQKVLKVENIPLNIKEMVSNNLAWIESNIDNEPISYY